MSPVFRIVPTVFTKRKIPQFSKHNKSYKVYYFLKTKDKRMSLRMCVFLFTNKMSLFDQ